MDALKHTGATEIASYLSETEVKGRDVAWKIRQAVEVIEASQYRFEQLKSKPKPARRALKRVILAVPRRSDLAAGELAIREGQAVGASHATSATCPATSARRNISPTRHANWASTTTSR
jgi:leucyl aminopeptidase